MIYSLFVYLFYVVVPDKSDVLSKCPKDILGFLGAESSSFSSSETGLFMIITGFFLTKEKKERVMKSRKMNLF